MGRVIKRGVLQNIRSSLQAHYSSLCGPARGLNVKNNFAREYILIKNII
jgi:hypothetical protein